MFDPHAASVSKSWLGPLMSAKPNFLNYSPEILAADYFEKRAEFDKPNDYRSADFICCEGLLLLCLNQDIWRVDVPPLSVAEPFGVRVQCSWFSASSFA